MAIFRVGPRGSLVLLVAILGAVCGSITARRAAHACECSEEKWRVSLRSVTSDTAGVSHESFWPLEGELTSYPGHAHIWAVGAAQSQVHVMGAGR